MPYEPKSSKFSADLQIKLHYEGYKLDVQY